MPFVVDAFGRRRFDAADVDRIVAEVGRYQLDEVTRTDPKGLPETSADVAQPPAGVTTDDVRRLLGLSGASSDASSDATGGLRRGIGGA